MGNVGWRDDEDLGWDDVSTDPPKPLEPGLYSAQVIEAKAEPTKEGKPCVLYVLEVTASADGAHEVNGHIARIQYQRVNFQKTAVWKAKQLAESSGTSGPRRSNYGEISEWANELVGKNVIVRLAEGRPNQNGVKYLEAKAFFTEGQLLEQAQAASASTPARTPPKRTTRAR